MPEFVVLAKPAVPVKVGEAEKTTEPVPVSFESEVASWADVIEPEAVP